MRITDKNVIVACDFGSGRETLDFLSRFGDTKPFVKIGMELFYSEGPAIVREIKKRGHKIFLDLKLHDIPNTVRKAMAAVSRLGVDMVNLHAAGGIRMMREALEGLAEGGGRRPLLIAVTQLTSTSGQMLRDELLISSDMEETVAAYARNAARAGLDGVVCSVLEVKKIKAELGAGFLTVTPGIRFSGDETGDQMRVATPADAGAAGSDYIVVGRSVTSAADPLAAYERCVREFAGF